MEELCSPLSWAYYYQEEEIGELKNSVFYSTLDLEASVLSAHNEIAQKDDEILQLKSLIAKAIRERDEFQGKCHTLVLEKQLLFQQAQKIQADSSTAKITTNQEENTDPGPSNSDENNPVGPTQPQIFLDIEIADKISCTKPLPEKGKFLQAVMEAGPLLQTLLLAGQLPQWQHPPPQLCPIDIPPVTILSPRPGNSQKDSCLLRPNSGGYSHKRAKLSMERLDFSPKNVCVLINHH